MGQPGRRYPSAVEGHKERARWDEDWAKATSDYPEHNLLHKGLNPGCRFRYNKHRQSVVGDREMIVLGLDEV